MFKTTMCTRTVVAGLVFAAGLPPAPAAAQQPPVTVTLPPITVTAQKTPEDPQNLPVSVSTVLSDTLTAAGLRSVSEAGWFSPNTFFSEFTARKLSNARFRGVGASPTNPGITSYIDGVPQLNANSSSIELLDIEQIEFVRGPQSALFGRNALGGVINIVSARPSLKEWSGSLLGPYGNFNAGDLRGAASGPIVTDTLAVGVAMGYSAREGFTVNDMTGNDLDSRSAFFGKGQMLWKPNARWETRVMFTGERARDGDYALNDLDALRARPFHTARDVEGHTHRDIIAPTVQTQYSGTTIDLATTTGFLKWKTDDLTDLDYSPLPLITRTNAEEDFQFTTEARFSSAKAAPIVLSDSVTMRWQAGASLFTQNYPQDAINTYSPFLISPFISFPVSQHTPQAALDDVGVGVYGQGTWTFSKNLDVVAGLRGDFEDRSANLNSFYTPTIAPPTIVDEQRTFSDVSPQFAVAYRVAPRTSVYGTVARGFKAGGFNAASPGGAERYDQEHSWNYEAGVKASGLGDRVAASAAVFHIDWSDLQVNEPNPQVPGQFFIANAAGANSTGFEFELHARPDEGLDVFGSAGFTHARFADGSEALGANVSGNKLANTPSYTADFGAQYTRPLRGSLSLVARAEAICYGEFEYDDTNTARQEAYSLTNLRVGVRIARRGFVDLWLRNAFDTRYIPIAFQYPQLAPSGFVGENGAPRTFGIRAGVGF
jgi:iron complex outermembrane receptor protein